jgi:hypothetical protein
MFAGFFQRFFHTDGYAFAAEPILDDPTATTSFYYSTCSPFSQRRAWKAMFRERFCMSFMNV